MATMKKKKEDAHNNFDETVDNIVIGSGIGGLTVASLLSQLLKGKDQTTLLLEQHSTIGGCLSTFERGGYPFSVGLHWVGEMGPVGPAGSRSSKVAQILDLLQPPGKAAKWCALPETYETLYLGKEVLKSYETCRKKELIQEAFPEHKDKIAKYYAYAEKAADAFEPAMAYKMLPQWLVKLLITTGLFRFASPGYYEYIRPLAQVLDEFGIKDPELRGVLTYNWPEYGYTPELAPFLLQAYVLKHFSKGAFYPEGGPSKVRDNIVAQIEACGGQVRASSPVKQILVQQGRGAVGVELQNGTRIGARQAVISNAGYPNTFENLLPAEYELDEKLKSLKGSFAFLYLLVGLKGDHDDDWKLPHYIPWLYAHGDMENLMKRFPESLSEALETLKPEDLEPVSVSMPSGKDKTWKENHPGMSTLEIMTVAPWSWFAEWEGSVPEKRGTKYEDAKKKLAQLVWTRARQGLVEGGASSTKLPLQVEDLDFYELATPLTFAHYLRREHGAVYGLKESSRRFEPKTFFLKLRPEVPQVPGLYMSGQDVICDGIVPSMMGGVLAACKVVGVLDPAALMKKLRESREQEQQ